VVAARVHRSRPALGGTVLALLSAISFGVSTPLIQRLGVGVGSFATASCLYAGACLAGLLGRSRRSRGEPGIRRQHVPRVLLVALVGAAIAPALLAWGLARTSGMTASLMLNLEAVGTIALARLVRREHVGRRVAAASGVLFVGGALLVLDRAEASSPASVVGLLAVGGAALGWATDNTLSKPLSALDPSSVVFAKAALGTLFAGACAAILHEAPPRASVVVGLVLVGATSYGASLHLYLRAQRAIGAGRTASVFAAAPFCGAALAWVFGEALGLLGFFGALAMAVGLVLHGTERHAHAHVHEAIEHEHPHRHDDGHHEHVHDPMPSGEHTHVHRHGRLEHTHPHVPDVHHEHDHDHDHDH
jgi:drug/metabolite transporter (DMT)-like permease